MAALPHMTNRAIAALALLASALATIPFFASVIPAMTDVSSHVLVARILNEYENAALNYKDYFIVEWNVAPTAMFYFVLQQVQRLTGPYADARLMLVTWTIGLPLATWWLARASGNTRPWLSALLAVPLAFSWFVWMGFLPYIATIPLFAVSVAAWKAIRNPVARILVSWAGLGILFGFHIVGMCAAMATIVGLMLVRELRHEAVPADWLHTTLAMVPGLILLALYLGGSDAPSTRISYNGLVEQLAGPFRYTLASLTKSGSFVLAAWGLAVLAAAAITLRVRRPLPEVVPVAFMLLLLAVVVPVDLGALWPAGPRLMPYGLLLLIAAIQVPERALIPVTVVALATVGTLSYLTTDRVRDLDQGYRELRSVATSIPRGSRVLPIINGVADGPDVTWPRMALVSLVTVDRGGVNPYVFAKPYVLTNATPLSYRHEPGPESRVLFEPEANADVLQSSAEAYDYMILLRSSSQISQVVPDGFCVLSESRHVTLLEKMEDPLDNQAVVNGAKRC